MLGCLGVDAKMHRQKVYAQMTHANTWAPKPVVERFQFHVAKV